MSPPDLGRDPVVTGKQVMEIKHTLKEARSLTDPICPTGAATERWGCSRGEQCGELPGKAGWSRGTPCPSQAPLCMEVAAGFPQEPGAHPTLLSLAEPPGETVTFPCGVQAELRFHRLFSNVLSVCAKLQDLPAHLTDAQLMLRQPTVSPLWGDAGPVPLDSLCSSKGRGIIVSLRSPGDQKG